MFFLSSQSESVLSETKLVTSSTVQHTAVLGFPSEVLGFQRYAMQPPSIELSVSHSLTSTLLAFDYHSDQSRY
jgi:hypothetical protein